MFTYLAIGIVCGIAFCAAFAGLLVLVKFFFGRNSSQQNPSELLEPTRMAGISMANEFDYSVNVHKQNVWEINPATGLPMNGLFDFGGNLFGTNFNNRH